MATRSAEKVPAEAAPIGVDEQGRLPLPWFGAALQQARALQRSHALLLHGPAGVGHLEFSGLLAQAWLCEGREDKGAMACGRCGSCHLVRSRSHPDLLLVLPDAWRLRLGWLGDDELKADAKPSRDIRVEQVRQAIDWSHQTSGRGRGKVLLIHPADALNGPSANALLKTLEEPAAGLRLLLSTSDPERLLPTLRSRCQRLRLDLPAEADAATWLQNQGLAEPAPLLALSSGSPLEALACSAEGLNAELLADLPQRVAAGDASPFSGRPLPRTIDLLLKLAHDLMARAAGGAPRFFIASQWPPQADIAGLVAWQKALLRAARHDEHPWNAALLVESLVTQATALWPRAAAARPSRGGASLHSPR